MALSDFIVLIPCICAMIIGFLVKNALKFIPNRYIPIICAAVGVGINIWINMAVTPCVFVEGLVSGIAATGMFETVKNFVGGRKENGKDS